LKLFNYSIIILLFFVSIKSYCNVNYNNDETLINVDSVDFSEIFTEITDDSGENEHKVSSVKIDSRKQLLNHKVDSILNRYNLNYTKYSISVFSINSNSYYIEKNADEFLKPASVTKLLTTYSLLKLLPDTTILRTYLYTEDSDLSDGIINGNLFVRGVGDPTIELSDLDNLTEKLISLGIKKIEGKIIGDGNLYDKIGNRFYYSGDADEVEPVAPISALSLNDDKITVFVNTKVNGNNPKIQITPNSNHFIINNNTKLLASTKRRSGRLYSHSKLNDNGTQSVYLSGKIYKNSSYGVQDFNLNPPLSFASSLKQRLISNGIIVLGTIETIKTNVKIEYSKLNPVAEIGTPLMEIIDDMNKNSVNYVAENLYNMVGSLAQKDSVTTLSARKLEDSLMRNLAKNSTQLKKEIGEFKVYDGSGLSRRNKFSSRMICELLHDVSESNFFNSFINSLSVCGTDGTLLKRMKQTNAQMNLKAKTGTHRDVSGLAGYVNDLDGNTYAFCFFFNGPSVGTYKMIENELGHHCNEK